jgi:DNA-binding transcriptional ArsR family regulator
MGHHARMSEDLLDRILREIRERIRETRGAYEESQQLERALAALDADADGTVGAGRSQSARSGRNRSRSRGRQTSSVRARRGANREAILALVSERPGATAGEIADATGIARSTVASTLTRLAANGALERAELPGGGVGFRAGGTTPAS